MIEDVQKVNEMAQELLNQGMAKDREDAVKKAQEVLNKNIQNQQSINSENKVEVTEENKGLEYYKNMISRTKEQMERQLSVFTQKMNEMIKEINDIKEQLKSRGPAKSASEMNVDTEQPIAESTQEKQTELKKDEPHPKRGNATSEDVSIEKMFYFGNK